MFSNILYIRDKNWPAIVLFNLFIVATAGLLLRALHYTAISGLNYSYLLQAHSHFAFAGWGFTALFISFYHAYLPKTRINKKTYSLLFLATLISTWGMLFSFPFKGYATISTTFATLYIFVTYWFAIRFYRDTQSEKPSFSLKMAKAAVIFLVLSSAGPFTMGGIMASGNGDKPWAMNAIYFYLHFQYNGWFIFGILALFFKWMEMRRIAFSQKEALLFYRLLFWSCFPAFLLSVLWSKPGSIIFLMAGVAGFIQLVAMIPFIQLINGCKKEIDKFSLPIVKWIGIGIFIMLIIKYILEFLGAFPLVVGWTVAIRNLLIAYLHLVLLGVFTIFLLSYFIQERILHFNKITQYGLWIFLAGFAITEILLFGQSGLRLLNNYIPSFSTWMFFTTILLPAGAMLIWAGSLRNSRAKRTIRVNNKILINDTPKSVVNPCVHFVVAIRS